MSQLNLELLLLASFKSLRLKLKNCSHCSLYSVPIADANGTVAGMQ